jgi:hypothetical protein
MNVKRRAEILARIKRGEFMHTALFEHKVSIVALHTHREQEAEKTSKASVFQIIFAACAAFSLITLFFCVNPCAPAEPNKQKPYMCVCVFLHGPQSEKSKHSQSQVMTQSKSKLGL